MLLRRLGPVSMVLNHLGLVERNSSGTQSYGSKYKRVTTRGHSTHQNLNSMFLSLLRDFQTSCFKWFCSTTRRPLPICRLTSDNPIQSFWTLDKCHHACQLPLLQNIIELQVDCVFSKVYWPKCKKKEQ